MKILIVDDDRDNRELLRYIVEEKGNEAIVAEDGLDGLRMAKIHIPDLIISDALMPIMDGFQFLRMIKEDKRLRPIPFIFYSAVYKGDKDVDLAIALGAEAYIIKPKAPSALWEEVEMILSEQKEEKVITPELITENEDYLKRYSDVVAAKLEEKVAELEKEIAERNKIESELYESRKRYKSLFESSLDGIYRSDANGLFTLINQAGAEILGHTTPDEVIGQPVLGYWFDPGDRDKFMSELIAEKSLRSYHIHGKRKNGETIELELTSKAMEDERGNFIGVEGILRDITEKVRADERIQRQMQKLSALRSIDMAISSSFDLPFTLKIFIEHVVTELKVDAANVLLLNPHTKMLEYAASQGFRTNVLKHHHMRIGEGYAGNAALENQILGIPNLQVEDNFFVRLGLFKKEDFIAYYAVPLVTKEHVKGVLEIFHRSPLEPDDEWFEFLDSLALQAAIAIDNNSLFHDLERANMDLFIAYDSTIEGWSRALDYRDKETEGHSQRVTEMTLRIVREMGMNEEEVVHVRRGALLHDIGKMGIPDSILLKDASLTEEEWQIMRRHPLYAYELLYPIAYLRPALDIPYCHHEHWDGNGYPRGLKGEQIPLPARIFAVVDVWDGLRSDRPYRSAWSDEKAKEYLRAHSGTQFDPNVVDIFFKMKL